MMMNFSDELSFKFFILGSEGSYKTKFCCPFGFKIVDIAKTLTISTVVTNCMKNESDFFIMFQMFL